MPSAEEVRATIRGLVAEALDRDPAEVDATRSLAADLGAESIDFLDIQFRVEKAFGLKFTDDELWRGTLDLRDPRWVRDGWVTEEGMTALRAVQPAYPWERFAKGLAVRDLPQLLTVETIARQVERRLGAMSDP